MNDRRLTLAAGLTATAFALVTPALAFAQDNAGAAQPNGMVALDTTPLTMPVDMGSAPAVVAQSDQIANLESKGTLTTASIMIASLDQMDTPGWDSQANDRFQEAVDRVMVTTDADVAPTTLREYLVSTGVDPATVTGVQVFGSGVLILHS